MSAAEKTPFVRLCAYVEGMLDRIEALESVLRATGHASMLEEAHRRAQAVSTREADHGGT